MTCFRFLPALVELRATVYPSITCLTYFNVYRYSVPLLRAAWLIMAFSRSSLFRSWAEEPASAFRPRPLCCCFSASASRLPASTCSIGAPAGAVVVGGALDEAMGASSSRAVISASVSSRSFSRRTSLPRLWQYQKTKRRTLRAH